MALINVWSSHDVYYGTSDTKLRWYNEPYSDRFPSNIVGSFRDAGEINISLS